MMGVNMFWMWLVFFGQGLYFENATLYQAADQAMVSGQHLLLDAQGRVVVLSETALQPQLDVEVVRDALILPHFSDFYSLTQERGLGVDQDLDVVNQAMLMNSYRRGGIYLVRDPMFPAEAIDGRFTQGIGLHAMRGYVDLPQGPSAEFSIVADPSLSVDALLMELPDTGPVTLWWTSYGGTAQVQWERNLGYVKQLRSKLHAQGRKLGVFVQDARASEIRMLEKLVVDFVEGMPAEPGTAWPTFGEAIWIPMASLNDKRYCAKDLEDRMIDAANRGLYGRKMVGDVRERLRGIHVQVKERCEIWQKRRSEVLSSISAWAAAGGKLAIGSAGGHAFAFSGGIRMELAVLAEFGVKQIDLFSALFEHTPSLIGTQPEYMQLDQPAHFIVFLNPNQQPWHEFVGKRVDYNFTAGVQVVKQR